MLDDLDDLSLEELLELRESILEQKKNLTYYIEESDDDDDEEDEEYNSAANEEISDQLEALTHAKGEITDDVVD